AGVRSHLTIGPTTAGPAAVAPAAAEPLPPPAEFARHWPRFRGPDGGGTAAGEAPLQWNAATGAGVAWKTALPLPGHNSPIVWGNRVFLSGATREKREVYCFDATTGALLWQCPLEPPKTAGARGELSEDTGYAAPTLATDGRHVYAFFAHGDLTALTFAGRVAWTKALGLPRNPYGHATSLAVWEGRVLLQFDQGESEPANSRLLAFDGATGRQLWEKTRQTAATWATPIVVHAAGRPQIVTLGLPHVVAYAVADGAELWRAEVMEGEIAPSPIFAGDLFLIVVPGHKLVALRPDGAGDVTATHVAWHTEESMPDVTSPVSDGTWTLVATSGGEVVCLANKDGKVAWKKDLDLTVQASPAIFGGKLYVVAANGVTVVCAIGPEFRELARSELGEKVFATPAFAAGRLYVRGVKHLFCLAGSPPL
ncbi:MAG: serine/threonine protein kinase, partial [Verrucomicrobia bacterium]|nr:serine/threonine protein kinase [Verrucomicrobiota bacterium]